MQTLACYQGAKLIYVCVGIDPGLHGAVSAVTKGGRFIGVWDTPVATVTKTKRSKAAPAGTKPKKSSKTTYLSGSMAGVLHEIASGRWWAGQRRGKDEIKHFRIYSVAIEQVHAMPKQGVSSMFRMGQGLGLWEGICAGMGLPVELVPPQRWKKAMLSAGGGSDKGVSIARAQQLMPEAAEFLTRKKDDGRAEALLIALWKVRQGSV